MGKKKDICQQNNNAVIIDMINMARKVVPPKQAPMTMLQVIAIGGGRVGFGDGLGRKAGQSGV